MLHFLSPKHLCPKAWGHSSAAVTALGVVGHWGSSVCTVDRPGTQFLATKYVLGSCKERGRCCRISGADLVTKEREY